jgi:hypothetical protein
LAQDLVNRLVFVLLIIQCEIMTPRTILRFNYHDRSAKSEHDVRLNATREMGPKPALVLGIGCIARWRQLEPLTEDFPCLDQNERAKDR